MTRVHRLGSQQDRADDQGLLASGKEIDGVWTSGIDSAVVDAFKSAGKAYVPVVGADNNGFFGQLVQYHGDGLWAPALTNPPAVGAAGLGLRAQRAVRRRTSRTSSRSRRRSGTARRTSNKMKAAYNPKLDPYYSVAINVPPYTHFTMEQLLWLAKARDRVLIG